MNIIDVLKPKFRDYDETELTKIASNIKTFLSCPNELNRYVFTGTIEELFLDDRTGKPNLILVDEYLFDSLILNELESELKNDNETPLNDKEISVIREEELYKLKDSEHLLDAHERLILDNYNEIYQPYLELISDNFWLARHDDLEIAIELDLKHVRGWCGNVDGYSDKEV